MKKEKKQDEVRDRAVKVYRYVIRGFSPSEIGKLEGLPLKQVYWLIEEGGRIIGGDLKLLAKRGILKELFASHQERKKEFWLTYRSTRQGAIRVSCLARLSEEDKWFVELAERLGLIEPEEKKLDISLEHRIYDRDGLISRLKDLESRIS